ncbi:O-unit flippase, partial [Clostridium perfringens]
MRTKKAIINSSVNIISFLISFVPNLIIRRIFMETLGNDMLGLNSLYTNIIGWLSIIEMGIGSAIIYLLYKPFVNNDKKSIRAYIKFYGWFYKIIGFIILILGILIIPFLKYFIKGQINIKMASLVFLLFLINSFITYLFSNRLCILNVAQEDYKITIGITTSKLIIAIFQIIMFKIYPSFILFILIQLIINFIYFWMMNLYVTKCYPWLNQGNEKIEYNEKKELMKNIRAMFMHKIGSLVVNSTDNIVISKFVGLGALANYTNYQIIISALQSIVSQGLSGLTSSIGNMIASENKEQWYETYKKIFFINFWIVSFITISLYNTLNQFVMIWMGKDFLLDKLTFVVILINMYFSSMRGSVEQFKNASGNFYQDRYAAIFESLINLISSLILVNKIGISGVFIGTLISNFTVVFWTKPYVVYKYVFNKNLIEYFKLYFRYLAISVIPLIITNYLTSAFKVKFNFISFLINCIINIVVINIIYICIFFKTNEFRYYVSLLKGI